MSSFSIGVDTDFPDTVSATLTRSNLSKQCATQLNTAGTLLAVGCTDGVIAIYDFETRAVAKLLKGHTKPVIAVSWCRSSHHLLSASLDGLLIRWNVLDGTQGAYATIDETTNEENSEEEEKKIKQIQIHPNISDVAILNFSGDTAPLLVSLSPLTPEAVAATASNESLTSLTPPQPRKLRWSRLISTPYQQYIPPNATTTNTSADNTIASETNATTPAAAASSVAVAASASAPPVPDDREFYTKWHSTTAIFDHSGRFIFEGNSKGTVFAYELLVGEDPTDVNTIELRLIHAESNRVTNEKSRVPLTTIQSLVESPCGTYLMCNNSNQLKVYRLDSNLLEASSEGEQRRKVHHEALIQERVTQQIIQNGARMAMQLEKRLLQKKLQALTRKGTAKATMYKRDAITGVVRRKKKNLRVVRGGANGGSQIVDDKDEEEKDEKDATNEGGKDEKTQAEQEGIDATGGAVADEAEKEKEDGDKDEKDDKDDKDDKMDTSDSRTPIVPKEDDPVVDDLDDLVSELPPLMDYTNTFSDQVNRVPWRKCAFSHTSDFIIAGSAERGEHRIHIWSIHSGQLTKILLGPTEGLIDLVAHPSRPILVTCCTSGGIYLWNKNYVENWSAFAPDFEELDDNQEYVEKEDEFDIVPIDHLKNRTMEDIFVDICALDSNTNLNDLITLPATVLPDLETQQAYATRRQRAIEAAKAKATQQETTNDQNTDANMQDATQTTQTTTTATKRPLEDTAVDDINKKAKL